MRLFTKFFLFGMLLFGLAFSVSGYFLLHYSMESSLAREADFALKQYQYDKFTVQSALLTYSDFSIVLDVEDGLFPEEESVFSIWKSYSDGHVYADGQQSPESMEAAQSELVKSLFGGLAEEISVPAAFFAEDGTELCSEIEGFDASFLEGLSEDAHVYQFWNTPEGDSVLVGSMLKFDGLSGYEGIWSVTENYQGTVKVVPEAVQSGKSDESSQGMTDKDIQISIGRSGMGGEALPDDNEHQTGGLEKLRKFYFVTQWDISKTIRQQQTLRQYFVRCYLVAMAAGMVLLGILAALLASPLKRMSKAAGRMAEGYYEERLAISGRDEVGELAGSFNRMAGAVEEKIGELSRAAREKEDFVANFAHELKTPLTSIIGYADTIYQKNMPREEVRKAAWHIWNEGMRLEALSFKLMELTVLGRQEFPLVEMPAEELLQDVAEGLSPLMEEKGIDLQLEAEAAYIRVDYDLLKTLLINLVDNSAKAGAGRIQLQGQVKEGEYHVQVRDNGCGMEEEVLSRITEAFYMVDKARSRKQHGAGLGLALADRIAKVHGTELIFESRKGQGTEVRFSLYSRPPEFTNQSN